MRIKLIIEGGGDSRLDTQFRKAWTEFFRAAGLADRMPRIVRGKNRQEAHNLFVKAVAKPEPGILPLLLVDAEAPVTAGHSVWQHLRAHDNWARPDGAADNQAFLMVQLTETWLLADRALLQRYFGQHFKDNKIPQWQDLEAVEKDRVYGALESATAECPKRFDRNNKKAKMTFELLEKLDPTLVEAACPHAADLLGRLRKV